MTNIAEFAPEDFNSNGKFEVSMSGASNAPEDANAMNFLCGPGVFDWSESRLMQDVMDDI